MRRTEYTQINDTGIKGQFGTYLPNSELTAHGEGRMKKLRNVYWIPFHNILYTLSGLNWRDTFCSTLGTMALVYSTQPFDTTKTILQSAKRDQRAMEAVSQVVQKGGAGKLWAGATASLAGYLIEHAVLFTLFEAAKRNRCDSGRPRTSARLCAESGLLCGFCSFFSSVPLCVAENVKVKLQARSEIYQNPLQTIRLIYARNGMSGFFRGIQALWCRDAPFFTTYIFVHDYTYSNLKAAGLSRVSSTLVAGALGGAVAWTVIFPVDVIKSRWQSKYQYKNIFHAALSIWNCEGFGAFTHGYYVGVLRGTIAYACFACGYHFGQELLFDNLADSQLQDN